MKKCLVLAAGLLVAGLLGSAKADLNTLSVYGNSADGDGSSFVNNGGGAYDILAGGSDIWGNSDNGAFLYDPDAQATGDFTAIVRSVGFAGPDPLAGEWGRSGPMVRSDGAAADAANVMTTRKSGGGVGLVFQGRPSLGAGTDRSGPNGDFPDSGSFSGGATTDPVWLALSRMGDLFYGHWAPDAGGMPGDWSVAAAREVTPDLSGALDVGLAHQSHSLPRRNTAIFDSFNVGPFDAGLPTDLPTVLPAPGSLPGVAGGAGTWGVTEIIGVPTGGNLSSAVANLMSDPIPPEAEILTAQSPILDFTDPETNATGGPILGGTPMPFLSNTPVDDNEIHAVAKGRILVTPEQAGVHTFQVRSDDGFALRINGAEFTNVYGAGTRDFADPSTIFFGAGTGDSDTRATVDLAAGEYDVEFVWWEGAGGAYYEVTSAAGDHSTAGTAQWLALGDPSTVSAITSPDVPVQLVAPANVINGPNADSVPDAIAAIREAIKDPAAPRASAETVILTDGGFRNGGAYADEATSFPNGGGDNFSTGIFGSFLVDDGDDVPNETLLLTFGMFSDDGSGLHVFGEDFIETGELGEIVSIDGGDMMLQFPDATGNSNTFGTIALEEGVHGFEAFQYENAGGAGMELFVALGDQRDAFSLETFLPLTVDTSARVLTPGNQGLALVPEPSSVALAALGLLSLLGISRREKR